MPKLKSKYKKINEWEKHQLRPFYINKILDIVWSQEIWLHKKKMLVYLAITKTS